MTQEDKYKKALLEARAVLEPCLKYSNGKVREALDSIDKELKSFESEDERIRKLLIWQVHRNIEDETNDLAGSVYDGIKGHDPELEESIEDWKKCLAWLEKQKEQKPVEPSDDELQRHQDELYDFKVFAAKQAKEHHISFVHDFEWNNFCAELLSYFNEQKPADLSEMMVHKEPYLAPVPIPMVADEQKQEWSEEDEKMLEYVIGDLNDAKQLFSAKDAIDLCDKEIAWLKSLRPSWKPSEEQMKALQNAVALTACDKELARLYNQLKKL